MAGETLPPLRFTGSRDLAQRLVIATLTGRTIRISQIRNTASSSSVGLAPHEVSLLRLLDAISNGAHIELSPTGTTLLYKPGLLVGCSSAGKPVRHIIPATNTRGIAYFLVPLCLLAPFAKAPLDILFSGPGVITSPTDSDPSVDTIRTALLPLLACFAPDTLPRPPPVELKIIRRAHPSAFAPSRSGDDNAVGGGEVRLVHAAQLRLPRTIHWLAPGRVRRIRGVAATVGLSPATNARLIAAARELLQPLSPDTYIFSDVSAAPSSSSRSGGRPIGVGFSLSLVAETHAHTLYSADAASNTSTPTSATTTPESAGRLCALRLLDAVAAGGCVPASAAPAVLTLMALGGAAGGADVGRVALGCDVVAAPNVVRLARDLRTFGAAGWGLRPRDEGDGKGEEDEMMVVVSVVGKGVGNVGRKLA